MFFIFFQILVKIMVASTFVLILKTALYVTAKRVTPLTKTKKHAMVIVFYVVCHETIFSNVSTNMVMHCLKCTEKYTCVIFRILM